MLNTSGTLSSHFPPHPCAPLTPSSDLEAALCEDECPYADQVPAAFREVGHFEGPKEAAITFEEFRKELREAAADRLELFESRRVQRVGASGARGAKGNGR